jgi:hypothetical protein
VTRRPALIIPTTGAVRFDPQMDVSLDALQRLVGGTIECITLSDKVRRAVEHAFKVDLGVRPALVCNDEGLLLRLPVNSVASVVYTMLCREEAAIFGDCLICDVP